MSTIRPLPSIFLPHGAGPCFFMDWSPTGTWDRMADWLRGLIGQLAVAPKAILVVSAHWEAPEFTVNTQAAPGLLFDYSGFPEHTYSAVGLKTVDFFMLYRWRGTTVFKQSSL